MSIIQALSGISAGPSDPLLVGAVAGSESSATFTLAYPAGMLAGDLMVIVSSSKRESQDAAVPPTGEGWTNRMSDFFGFYPALGVFTNIANGTESGSIAMTGLDNQGGAVLFVVRNGSETLIDLDYVENNNATITAPSSTATAAGELHLVGATGNNIGTVLMLAAGYETSASLSQVNGGGAIGFTKTLTAAGATGTVVMYDSVLNERFYTWSLIVGPS